MWVQESMKCQPRLAQSWAIDWTGGMSCLSRIATRGECHQKEKDNEACQELWSTQRTDRCPNYSLTGRTRSLRKLVKSRWYSQVLTSHILSLSKSPMWHTQEVYEEEFGFTSCHVRACLKDYTHINEGFEKVALRSGPIWQEETVVCVIGTTRPRRCWIK